MSWDRFFHWTCDSCRKTEIRADYGLPQGWIFVKEMKTTNRCETCKEEIPVKQRGIPQVIARK